MVDVEYSCDVMVNYFQIPFSYVLFDFYFIAKNDFRIIIIIIIFYYYYIKM